MLVNIASTIVDKLKEWVDAIHDKICRRCDAEEDFNMPLWKGCSDKPLQLTIDLNDGEMFMDTYCDERELGDEYALVPSHLLVTATSLYEDHGCIRTSDHRSPLGRWAAALRKSRGITIRRSERCTITTPSTSPSESPNN